MEGEMNRRGEVVILLMVVVMGISLLLTEIRLRRQERWIELAFYDYSCKELNIKCKENTCSDDYEPKNLSR